MAELADAHDSGSCGATHAGSSPVIRTKSGGREVTFSFYRICLKTASLRGFWAFFIFRKIHLTREEFCVIAPLLRPLVFL